MRLVLIVALVAAGPALAQSQAAMDMKAGAAAKTADVAMNAQYRRTMAAMKAMDALGPPPDAKTGPSYANALLAAQRAWLAYRDAECTVQGYQFRGGSAQPMAQARCVADLTDARTRQLKVEMWPK